MGVIEKVKIHTENAITRMNVDLRNIGTLGEEEGLNKHGNVAIITKHILLEVQTIIEQSNTKKNKWNFKAFLNKISSRLRG